MVEPWIAGLWAALEKLFAPRGEGEMSAALTAAPGAPGATDPAGPEVLHVESQVARLRLEDPGRKGPEASEENVASSAQSRAVPADAGPSLTRSVPPLAQAALSVPASPPDYLQVHLQEPAGQVSSLASCSAPLPYRGRGWWFLNHYSTRGHQSAGRWPDVFHHLFCK